MVQDVIIELQHRQSNSVAPASKNSDGPSNRSVYAGWTGMASTTKSASVAEKIGRRPKEEVGVVEIDATFGRTLGLADGQKVVIFNPGKAMC